MTKQLINLSRVLSVLIISIIIFGGFANISSYADDLTVSKPLTIDHSYPENNGKNLPIQNLGIKLYFSEDINGDKNLEKANRAKIHFYDYKGKLIGSKYTSVYFSSEEKNYALAVLNAKRQLASNKKYKVVIEKGFEANDGAMTAEDITINFTTVNSSLNTKIYMVLMIAMFIAMFGFMAYKNRKDAQKKAEGSGVKMEKMNPYVIAKQKGISVEQARQIIAKKQAKIAKKIAEKEKDNRIIKKVSVAKGTKEVGVVYKKAIPNPNQSNKQKKKKKKKR
jgi:hypothetical protein